MISPPVLNDLRAIIELASQGVDLDPERARLAPQSPLTEALASRLSFGGMGAETFVLYGSGRKSRALGVVQARLRKNRPEADITFIAPALENDPDAVTTWYRLLSEATRGLGELGCQRIYVQVPAGNSTEQVLHQAGFTSYCREEVFRIAAERACELQKPASEVTIRRQRKRDAWGVLRLYSAITPRSVQLAEAMLPIDDAARKLEDWWDQASGTGYVLEKDGELIGAARLTRGSKGSWLRLHLGEKGLSLVDDCLGAAVALAGRIRSRPVYVVVRDYEVGISAALIDAGFEWQLERSLMVKHTTARVKEPLPWLAPVRETPVTLVRQCQRAKEPALQGDPST